MKNPDFRWFARRAQASSGSSADNSQERMAALTAGKQLPSLLELTKTFPVPDEQKNADQETKDNVPSDLDQLVPDDLEELLPDHPDNHEG